MQLPAEWAVDSILILAQVRLNEFDFLAVDSYVRNVRACLEDVDGHLGLSAWQHVRDRSDVLIAYHYRDVDSAEKGLVATTGTRLLAEEQTADYRPADVLRMQVHQRYGKALHEVPETGFLSISTRVADPGYGAELLDEIDRIFQELQFIPGHLGSLSGPNDTLPEEIVGIALWNSQESFQASIPPSAPIYEVRLYRRIA